MDSWYRSVGEGARRAAMPLAAIALSALGATPTAALQPTAPASFARGLAWSVEIGATRVTPLVEDGNGVTVHASTGVSLGAQLALRQGKALTLTTGLRASTAAIRVESTGRAWRAERTQRYDAHLGVEATAFREVRLGVSGFGGVVTGPDDVIPFRRGSGRITVWGGEVIALYPILREPRLHLAFGADLARLASQPGENPPMAGGWVGRLRLGLRHAR